MNAKYILSVLTGDKCCSSLSGPFAPTVRRIYHADRLPKCRPMTVEHSRTFCSHPLPFVWNIGVSSLWIVCTETVFLQSKIWMQTVFCLKLVVFLPRWKLWRWRETRPQQSSLHYGAPQMALIFSSHPFSSREVDAFIWDGQIAKKEKMRMMCPWLVIVFVYVFWKRTMGKEGSGQRHGDWWLGCHLKVFSCSFCRSCLKAISCHSYKIMPFQYG